MRPGVVPIDRLGWLANWPFLLSLPWLCDSYGFTKKSVPDQGILVFSPSAPPGGGSLGLAHYEGYVHVRDGQEAHAATCRQDAADVGWR